jgi:hypothetical protein
VSQEGIAAAATCMHSFPCRRSRLSGWAEALDHPCCRPRAGAVVNDTFTLLELSLLHSATVVLVVGSFVGIEESGTTTGEPRTERYKMMSRRTSPFSFLLRFHAGSKIHAIVSRSEDNDNRHPRRQTAARLT